MLDRHPLHVAFRSEHRLVNCALLTIVLTLLATFTVYSQSVDATLSGSVIDTNGAAVPGASITIINVGTNLRRQTTTNDDGEFTIPLLPPATYTLRVERQGFAPVEVPNVILNVGDQKAMRIELKVGTISEMVQVNTDAPLINESPAVGTTVDRQFVGNLPLNGRSFQSLITLSPGVVLTKATIGEAGQFSVNGQRANANYFMVDGAGANVGVSGGGTLAQSAGGALPGLTSFGGTNGLVSVDALQEFKILTSTYAPEFGRMPGGQISLITRSGTNQFRGSVFEYFRNDVFDANDWFANRSGTARPALRQNDFGGVFGGPIVKNRTFFFVSYEGLRLRQPQTVTVIVPTMAVRQSAPANVQAMLRAYPIPNGRVFTNGLAEFIASYSDPLNSDASSVRLDHLVNSRVSIFGRYNYAPSDSAQRFQSRNNIILSRFKTQTLTIGSNQNVSARTINEFRFNFSQSTGSSYFLVDNLGGAVPPVESLLLPPFASSQNAGLLFQITGAENISLGRSGDNSQRQLNFLDGLSIIVSAHQIKFGIDYRRLTPVSGVTEYRQSVRFSSIGVTAPGVAPPAGSVLSGKPSSMNFSARDSLEFIYTNFSAYGQDSWRVNRRFTLTYGVRWEVNPPPKGSNGKPLFTLALGSDPASVALSPAGAPLAPQGTPLYATTYNNFAPRLGAAYQLFQTQGRETIMRGGFGVFYDLGNGAGLNANSLFPYSRSASGPLTFPLTDPTLAQAPVFSLTPLRSGMFVYDPKLKLPLTYQWNLTLEQSVGSNQSFTATYVGAGGRRLLRSEQLFNSSATASFRDIRLFRNAAKSDYHALQLQFQRRLSKALQALFSYTWSKSLDTASDDSTLLIASEKLDPQQERGPSDFDLRHAFNGAVTYNLPSPKANRFCRAILGEWSIDAMATARSATPVNVVQLRDLGPGIGSVLTARPDLLPGIPLYLSDPTAPGGKRFNNTVDPTRPGCKGPFCPTTAQRQGTLGRNTLRGFSIYQVDLALRRQFKLTERISLQFRAEAFNLFNHPNFADPSGSFSSSLFGESTRSFGQSLGSGGISGGLSPIYQIGGARSMQFALRLQF